MNQAVYVVCPRSTDPEFAKKQLVLEELGAVLGFVPVFPEARAVDADCVRILDEMKSAACVLVDLSYERPSCYFELGFARGVGARVVLVASENSRIHQTNTAGAADVARYRDLAEYHYILSKRLAEFLPSALVAGEHSSVSLP